MSEHDRIKRQKAAEATEHAAFPGSRGYVGMSLRDYFAGQALAGITAHGGWRDFAGLAEDAYGAADAMLRFRKA